MSMGLSRDSIESEIGRRRGDELYRGLRGLGEVFDSLDKKHAQSSS